ncbi:MAG: mercury resistance system transport protein MerF [Acidobacteria bacterium]|nr:mercury resistance system transport protein MerF [Acidobacteriota bacterium]
MFSARGRFIAAVTGTIAIAICCSTPVLLIVLTAIGLGALTRYLDYVLLPSLAVLVWITWRAYREYARGRQKGGA